MKICTATFSSLTYAMKAQKALADTGTYGKIVKLDTALTKKGCAYGVEFFCEEQRRVRTVLQAAGVRPSRFLDAGGGTIV